MGKRAAITIEDARAACRQALLARRSEVLANLGVKMGSLAEAGRIPEEDQAQMTHDEFVSSRLNHLELENLRLVEAAIERLDTDDFGVCALCGRPIPARRLAAVPWAEHCVVCQDTLGAEPIVQPLQEEVSLSPRQ